MSIYAISDLHLSFNDDSKSMEFFGPDWKDYVNRIKNNWIETVKEEDTVLIGGDISWANNLEEAKKDFGFINSLPGKKIMIKGNHDYYFSTMKKVNRFLRENNFDTISILYNNSYVVENVAICGTRGWGNVGDVYENLDSHKIILREIGRLKLSYESLSKEDRKKEIVVLTHFPPFYHEFKEILKQINAKVCIYGHLHGNGHYMVKQVLIDGINYIMVSGDYTDFKLIKIK